MKRFLVLVSVFLLFGANAALAQTTYQVTTVPTFVINTGRAEVLGGVRVTAQNVGPTVASTIQYTFIATSCDNDNTDGQVLTVSAPFTTGLGGNTNISSVTNTSAGCVVAITVAGGLSTSVGTSFIELDGVRGRIDFLGGIGVVGTNINASLSATPSNSSLFTVPNQGVVGITAVGLTFIGATQGTVLQCVGIGTNPTLQLAEGFNGAFVQHKISIAGTALPTNARPVFGGLNNTQVHINVLNIPSGVTLTWPAFVNSQLSSSSFAAGTALGGSRLELLASSTATDEVYEYVCGDQAQCDINTEQFNFTATNPNTGSGGLGSAKIVLAATSTAAFGTATAAINLFPPLATGDATLLTDPPNKPGASVAKPRFNDPLRPSPPAPIATNAPCRTDLLFPWVVLISSAGFDTGIAIANTSTDPFGAVGALNQTGKCVLNGFPTTLTTLSSGPTATAAISFTTPIIPTGATYAAAISTIPAFSATGFTGYVIAVCDFQFGHGFAFISQNLGASAGIVEGYLALVIPDPNIVTFGGHRAANTPTPTVANQGEQLSN